MAKAKVVAQAQETEKKVAFNSAEFATQVKKAFAGNQIITVVADSELEQPRDTSMTEMAYLHFFSKGTEKDLFKMYNMPKKTRFAVSKVTELPASDNYSVSPVMNNKTQQVKWINIYTAHENAVDVAKLIIEASVAGAERVAKEREAKKAAKAAEKKATEKKAVEKKATAKVKTTKKAVNK